MITVNDGPMADLSFGTETNPANVTEVINYLMRYRRFGWQKRDICTGHKSSLITNCSCAASIKCVSEKIWLADERYMYRAQIVAYTSCTCAASIKCVSEKIWLADERYIYRAQIVAYN